VEIEWTEAVWRGLVESAPDALVMVDVDGNIVYVSAQTQRFFGYTREELLNQKIECLLPVRFRERHVGQRSSYFESLRVRPMGAGLELFGLHKSGAEIPVEISLSPLETPKGYLVTAAIRDISDRKRAQEELRKAREVAEAASRFKSEFLANMSHEIRTPLAGILGFAEMIALYCNSSEERKSYLDKIRRCADTLTELINDILDLSKVEAGALKVELLSINTVSEIENVASLFQHVAAEKHISFEVHYDRPLPEWIVSDPTRLRQILSNLLGNAIKFTDQGGVSLHVFTDKADSNRLCFAVKDSGVGLTPEQQTRLFQPFSQADSSTTRKFGGTGLGLALSRRLAKALDGELTLADSARGRGSVFQLSIPIKPKGFVGAETAAIEAPPTGTEERASWPRLDNVRILVAEDNPDNQEMLNRFLGAQGALVETASNGRTALNLAKGGTFQVILMDVQMPELDGNEVTKQLRKHNITTPIIALTAHAMNDEREKSFAAGCNEFLTKPLDVKKLIYTVHKYCTSISPPNQKP
jgi:PAS domain S-box-containing protein